MLALDLRVHSVSVHRPMIQVVIIHNINQLDFVVHKLLQVYTVFAMAV